jgi:hypothetical protein
MTQCKQNAIEIPVFIGNSKKLPVRLIVELMPEEVFRKRNTKLQKYNKANGHKTSNQIKDRLRFNLFVTNVESDKMEVREVSILYKLRWQVELVFKCWKSHMKINNIQKMKYERFTAILYGKLLLILINNEIIHNIRCKLFRTKKRLLSMVKCAKTMQEHNAITRQIIAAPNKISEIVRKLEIMMSLNHWQDKRKNRLGWLEIIKLFNRKSDIYAIFKENKRGNAQAHNPLIINNLSSLLS